MLFYEEGADHDLFGMLVNFQHKTLLGALAAV